MQRGDAGSVPRGPAFVRSKVSCCSGALGWYGHHTCDSEQHVSVLNTCLGIDDAEVKRLDVFDEFKLATETHVLTVLEDA